MKLMAAQDVIAKVYGYRDHRDLMKSLGAEPPSVWDDGIELNAIRERQDFQVKALSQALRIEEQVAASIIAEIRPTGRRSTTKYDDASSFPDIVDSRREQTVVVVRKSRKFLKGGVGGRTLFNLTRSNTSL